ncbi:MAG TPA: MarR family winged helix-turn-helix transcriptional regulator [Humisphaera sp.]|nr:MarR family winged helix-turn-helix transcriptional regulator [Humisphaera sp.]
MSDPLDQLIWYLGRAYYTYVGVLEKMLDQAGLKKHVQPGMGHILFALFSQDDLTIKEIARRSKLANSTLTGLLNRMETGKLIERRRDSADGRLVRVRLTSLGRSLEPGCRQVVATLDGIFQKHLGEKNVRQSKRLLREIIDAMQDADTNGDGNGASVSAKSD